MLTTIVILLRVGERTSASIRRVAKVTWRASAKNDRSATEFVAISGRRDHLSFDMRYMWKRHLPRRDDCKKHIRDVQRGGTAGYV